MDPFDVTENVSLIDNGKDVTLIVGDNEEILDLRRVNYMRMWLEGWATEPDRLSKSLKKEIEEDQ